MKDEYEKMKNEEEKMKSEKLNNIFLLIVIHLFDFFFYIRGGASSKIERVRTAFLLESFLLES